MGKRGTQQLERDLASWVRLARPEDNAHAAVTESPENLVLFDAVGRLKRIVCQEPTGLSGDPGFQGTLPRITLEQLFHLPAKFGIPGAALVEEANAIGTGQGNSSLEDSANLRQSLLHAGRSSASQIVARFSHEETLRARYPVRGLRSRHGRVRPGNAGDHAGGGDALGRNRGVRSKGANRPADQTARREVGDEGDEVSPVRIEERERRRIALTPGHIVEVRDRLDREHGHNIFASLSTAPGVEGAERPAGTRLWWAV